MIEDIIEIQFSFDKEGEYYYVTIDSLPKIRELLSKLITTTNFIDFTIFYSDDNTNKINTIFSIIEKYAEQFIGNQEEFKDFMTFKFPNDIQQFVNLYKSDIDFRNNILQLYKNLF
jgi:hypothetical protein